MPALPSARLANPNLERECGVLGYTLDAKPIPKTFWTLSAWGNEEALRRFSRAEPHWISDIRAQMPESTFTHVAAAGDATNPWKDDVT
jgi:hypothetical protein